MTQKPATVGSNARSTPLNLRAPHDLVARLDTLAGALPLGLSRHHLAVVALRLGVEAVERDPALLLGGLTPKAAPAPAPPAAPAPAREKRAAPSRSSAPSSPELPPVDPRQLALVPEAEHPPQAPAPDAPVPEGGALIRRYLRARKSSSRSELARESGVPKSTLQSWETKGGELRPDNAQRVAAALDKLGVQ